LDSYSTRGSLRVEDQTYTYYRLAGLEAAGFSNVGRLHYSIRILLENLLHYEDGVAVTQDDIPALASWDAQNVGEREIAFRTARVLLQDFTGVPCVVDLAAMRDAIIELGGNPQAINPLQTSELVIDHSVQVDEFGTRTAFAYNARMELER